MLASHLIAVPDGARCSATPLALPRLLHRALTNPISMWTQEHFTKLVVSHHSPAGKRVVVSDPAILRHILVTDPENFPRDALQQRIIRRVTGDSLFSAQGEDWKHQRKLLAGLFSPAQLQTYRSALETIATAACQTLTDLKGEVFDLFGFTGAIAIEAVNRTLLGGRLAEPAKQVDRSIQDFALMRGRLRISDLAPFAIPLLDGWRKAPRCVHARSTAVLATLRAEGSAPDAVDTLHGDGQLSFRQRRDNISTLLGAGSDTTGAAMAWALLLASRDEPAAIMLASEVEDAHRAVILESLRLFPPAPVFSRTTLKTCTIGGVRLAKGTDIIIAPWVIHRHRALWPDADMFEPTRFLPENAQRIPRFAFLPFGGGPRICIGQGLAMLELETVLPALFRRFRFETVSPLPVELRQVITLRPKRPVLVRATPR